jgi:hypothetical protein
MPRHWVLATRLSEGGGKILWDQSNKPFPCPGLEYDRPGALFLQQNIAVKKGETYRIGAELKTIEVKGAACLHIDFYDTFGGSLYRDITEMPSGEYFSGTNDWTHDLFEVRVPQRATFAQLRLAINNSGRVFVKNIMMNPI